MINWCPTCASTISDLEVRHEHAVDTLYEVRYRIAGTDDFLTVATVRPETILADTAVAVHPDDERYRHLVGRTAIVPLVDREVPIIADEYVKMDFGTGALKVTPGHDPNDFEIGRRHGLPELSAIGFDGRMTELAGEFAGLPAAEAREKVRDALFAQDLLRHEEPYEHEVGHCDRSGDRIEPLISLQWFMQMDELAKPANEAVRSGRVRFHPKNQENIYYDWMLNLRPWCISRQLWWGHQIPVWYCPDGHETVELSEPDACATCGSGELERDPDVLDTWFSSALWPFATLGWPGRDDPRLERYYPGHVLATARDIINLWVARMLMMGLEFMGDIPFEDVVINPTIQAPDGRRMSKSLGTGIDPLELVDSYGADATRYGLLKMSSTQDVRFSAGMIEEGAKFANKLWNAARFVLTQADTAVAPAPAGSALEDRWIRSRLAAELDDVVGLIDRYDFSAAVKSLYAFVWNDFCDWYVEAVKPRLRGDVPRRRIGQPPLGARADPGAHPPVLPVRDRGRLGAHARRARAAHAGPASLRPTRSHRDLDAERDMGRAIEIVTAARADPGAPIEMPGGFAGADIVARLAPKRAADGQVPDRAGDGARARQAPRRARPSPGDARKRAVHEQGASGGGRGRAREGGPVRRRGECARVAAGRARVTAAERYIDSLELFGMAFGLERMHGLLAQLGNPERSFDAIHVVGTNGKGSTVALRRGAARGRGRAHGRLPLAAHHVVSGAGPDRRGRDRPRCVRGGGAARARRGRYARDAVRGADRGGVLRIRRRRASSGGWSRRASGDGSMPRTCFPDRASRC